MLEGNLSHRERECYTKKQPTLPCALYSIDNLYKYSIYAFIITFITLTGVMLERNLSK